jgi:hypothetical protein
MRYVCGFLLLVLCLATTVSVQAEEKTLTNAEVVKLVKLGIGDDVVIAKIRQAPTVDFKLETDDLGNLKAAGVSGKVIAAMLDRSSSDAGASAAAQGPGSASAGRSGFGTGETPTGAVYLIDGPRRTRLMRASPGSRTSGVAKKIFNPFAKMKMMTTFKGDHAELRTGNTSPVFEASLPSDLSPSDSILLVKLSVEDDGREISVGSGRLNVSVGIDKDDTVPIKIDESPTRTGSNATLKIYRVTVALPLPAGEYAFLLQNTLFYDFGVDGRK